MTLPVTRERLHRLPKAELHVHLDGSVRPQTMIELAAERNVPLPTTDPEALAAAMHAEDAQNLEEYLERFRITLSLMQYGDQMERIAYELAEDNALENVKYIEVRYSPILSTVEGLPLTEAVEAPLRGLRRAEEKYDIRTSLIVCGIRNMNPETSRDLADLTVAFKGRGVVAFDLAGAEYNYPAKKHKNAFFTVINKNMATTIHAGEAYGPESIHQALHYCRANRIGHGTRLFEDPDLMSYVRDFRIPLEICLTSNVQTRAVSRFEDHPIRQYYDEGLVVTLNTDNRLISATTLTEEFWRAHEHLGFDWSELVRVARMGFESAFLSLNEKASCLSGLMLRWRRFRRCSLGVGSAGRGGAKHRGVPRGCARPLWGGCWRGLAPDLRSSGCSLLQGLSAELDLSPTGHPPVFRAFTSVRLLP